VVGAEAMHNNATLVNIWQSVPNEGSSSGRSARTRQRIGIRSIEENKRSAVKNWHVIRSPDLCIFGVL
jgi:hypothetical protein